VELGEISMKDRGNIILIAFCSFIAFLFLTISIYSQYPYYYVASYGNSLNGPEIVLSKINLDQKLIELSTSLPMTGQIQIYKPMQFHIGNDLYYFISSSYGAPGKNSPADTIQFTNYSILNSRLAKVSSGQLNYYSIFNYFFSLGDTSIIRYTYYGDSLSYRILGTIYFSNFQPIISPIRNSLDYETSIDTFLASNQLYRIKQGENKILWSIANGVELYSFNESRNVITDSIVIGDEFKYSNIFGLNNNNTLVYSFNINYNIMGGPEDIQKRSIEQSYVKIYNADTFGFIDSLSIPDPSISDGYIMPEYSSCDNVGPFLLYYYFSGEDYRFYAPAMLFIFDTRTNEATWLRVGWR
jgi:hypothetical protein